MNQEFKNFDDLMKGLEQNLEWGNFGASKTVVNIYDEMLPNIVRTHLNETHTYDTKIVLNKHLEVLKKLDNTITNKFAPTLISNGEYKSLHNLQYTQNKIKLFIHQLENVLNQFEIYNTRSSQATKDLLDLSIKTGTLITQTNESIRGTGKSTELIKKASELEATLVVGSHHMKKYIDMQSTEMGYKIDCKYISNLTSTRGLRLKNNKFLVDDSTPNVIIKGLIDNNNEFVGGFNSINNSVTLKEKTTIDHLQMILKKLMDERDIINATYQGRMLCDMERRFFKLLRKIEIIQELIEEEKLENKNS